MIKKNNTVYAGTDNGVYKITNNGNVTHMSGTKDFINSLTIDANGAVYAGADNRGKIYKSNGSDFELIKQRDDAGSIKSLVIDTTGIIFAGSDNGNVYMIDNENLYTKLLETGHEIKRLVFDRQKNLFVGVDANQVYKKQKDSNIFYEMIGINNDDEHILALAIGPDDSLFAAGVKGFLYTSDNFN